MWQVAGGSEFVVVRRLFGFWSSYVGCSRFGMKLLLGLLYRWVNSMCVCVARSKFALP